MKLLANWFLQDAREVDLVAEDEALDVVTKIFNQTEFCSKDGVVAEEEEGEEQGMWISSGNKSSIR